MISLVFWESQAMHFFKKQNLSCLLVPVRLHPLVCVSVSTCLEAYLCLFVHCSSHQHENQFSLRTIYMARDAKGPDS